MPPRMVDASHQVVPRDPVTMSITPGQDRRHTSVEDTIAGSLSILWLCALHSRRYAVLNGDYGSHVSFISS